MACLDVAAWYRPVTVRAEAIFPIPPGLGGAFTPDGLARPENGHRIERGNPEHQVHNKQENPTSPQRRATIPGVLSAFDVFELTDSSGHE
jgi:hypothetical protein